MYVCFVFCLSCGVGALRFVLLVLVCGLCSLLLRFTC